MGEEDTALLVAGSTNYADIAQVVEQRIENPCVVSSTLTIGTKFRIGAANINARRWTPICLLSKPLWVQFPLQKNYPVVFAPVTESGIRVCLKSRILRVRIPPGAPY